MNIIYKYDLLTKLPGVVGISLPADAKVLCVKEQQGSVMLWAIIDPEKTQPSTRYFAICWTGVAMPDNAFPENYIGTVQVGEIVCHVFEVKNL